jgi:hypothetical protein
LEYRLASEEIGGAEVDENHEQGFHYGKSDKKPTQLGPATVRLSLN